MTGFCFIFAGCFGLVSAWTAERDPSSSIVFNLLSAHLYLLEAIGLVFNRMDFAGHACIKRSVRLNDICFVVATSIDVALSYTALFNVYKMSLVHLGTFSAALWLFCGVFYVGATLYARRIGHFLPEEVLDGKEEADVDAELADKVEAAKAENEEEEAYPQ